MNTKTKSNMKIMQNKLATVTYNSINVKEHNNSQYFRRAIITCHTRWRPCGLWH